MMVLCAAAFAFFTSNLQAASNGNISALMSSKSSLDDGSFEKWSSTTNILPIANSTELIDNSIDSANYYIGGGDVFSVHIMELPSVEYTAVIDQNCDAVIPELGLIRIGKKNLGEAKAIIGHYIQSKVKKQYTVYVSLTKTKSAFVSITGAVSAPGTYQFKGTYRLLDVLRKANDNLLPSINDCNYRAVVCSHGDSITSYDLFQYLFKHDLSQNPYVYPGDNIALEYSKLRVYVNGCIKSDVGDVPSLVKQVPIKNDEPIKDFLSLLPFDESADSNNVIIKRHAADGSSRTFVFSLLHPDNSTLENQDMVIITKKKYFPHIETITLSGEVLSPGLYPIIKDKTTVKEILEISGGLTQYADINRAAVIRHRKSVELKNVLLINPSTLQSTQTQHEQPIIPPNFIRPEVSASINNTGATNDFSVIPIKNDGKDMVLEFADEIFIPQKEYVVYVSGKVANPGAYLYVAGKERSYYIEQAGGYAGRADKGNVSVMTIYGGGGGMAYHVNDKSKVMAGDIVVIPESQQYKTFNMVWSPTLSYMLAAISLSITAYVTMKK